MTTSIIRPWPTLVLLTGSLLANFAVANDSPHWDKAACQTCHTEAAPVGGQVNLNAADVAALCDSCHGDRGDALPCRHASDIPLGSLGIADELRPFLNGGQVVCLTCHDIVYQCEHPKAHYEATNPGFLRARQSHKTSDYCAHCHDAAEYEKLNPHVGVTETPPRPTCQLCHKGIPKTSSTGQLMVDFNMKGDLNDTCFGCHAVRPHPRSMTFGGGPQDNAEWVHFVRPSEMVLENMSEAQAETGIGLPLNPHTGEVFCATCHNPHDFKVGGEHGIQVPMPQRRLRINNICQACHDK